MTNQTNTYSEAIQDLSSNLSLNKLKQLIEPFRDMKILIGITCRPEFYDHLTKTESFIKTKESMDDLSMVKLYVVNNQEQPVKYWYNHGDNKLNEYLKENQ